MLLLLYYSVQWRLKLPIATSDADSNDVSTLASKGDHLAQANTLAMKLS